MLPLREKQHRKNRKKQSRVGVDGVDERAISVGSCHGTRGGHVGGSQAQGQPARQPPLYMTMSIGCKGMPVSRGIVTRLVARTQRRALLRANSLIG